MMRGCVFSEMLMSGGCVRSILLLPLVTRCLEKIVYIYGMFDCIFVVVTGGGSLWECLLCIGFCLR